MLTFSGWRARAMGVGPPFELASSPPFATMQIAYKSACVISWARLVVLGFLDHEKVYVR